MLFNSYTFILVFLPLVFALFHVLRRWPDYALAMLFVASVVFYSWWDWRWVPLLLGSILVNFTIGRAIATHAAAGRTRASGWLLALGITLNLLALCYFKYAGFLATNIHAATGWSLDSLKNVVLPIGISFFTFTQIAFLVDAQRGLAREYRFVDYGLFVTWFPHLVAGPVLHHKEMMPQFRDKATFRFRWENVAVGLTIFSIGLAKKVVLADGIAQYVVATTALSPFVKAETGAAITFLEAWSGALAYTLQLYFDFSGYSDMAIGLSRMFGVRLPLNFDSPYKAQNISEFWRRWHMTLSRFLRDYLYIPLGGNRRGEVRRNVNLMATMLLGGLWHGAGWTFVIWGGLHGLYLVIHQGFRGLRARLGHDPERSTAAGRVAARALTFLAVVIGWVVFRADSAKGAIAIYKGMLGVNGLGLVAADKDVLGPAYAFLIALGAAPSAVPRLALFPMWGWIIGLLLIVWLLPNSQQIMVAFPAALEKPREMANRLQAAFAWKPSATWAIGVALVFLAAFSSLGRPSAFLYFQF
jgi:D-alanyl-lipoteichoic acid acyltransferase DltB (MBOAT superfamily)